VGNYLGRYETLVRRRVDEAIYYAITVCALFNFYNRWIDAAGVHAMSEEAHREFGKRTATHGYNPK
jgi:hypothetical protein